MSSLWGGGGRLVELDNRECFELLGGDQVGRVAFCDDLGPLTVPVNYRVHGGTVLFATSPFNSLARHLRESPMCSFEVDSIDDFTRSGWSVLVRGSAAFVRHPGWTKDEQPDPWPEGSRTLIIRITPSQVSGRRLLPS